RPSLAPIRVWPDGGILLAFGEGIALRRTVSGPSSESGPCDRSFGLRASAGSGNAAIGSRALIGRAWSCRSHFGRRASFDHQRNLCADHFLSSRAATGDELHAVRRNRKDSPDHQKARAGTFGLRG